jgi:uncharacterized protein (TIGR03435 family)
MRINRLSSIAVIAIVITAHPTAQTGSPPRTSAGTMAFDVASVKPNISGDGNFGVETNQSGLTAVNVTVRALLFHGFGLRQGQLTGAPGWIDSERFDIKARAPTGSTEAQIPAMIQDLLKDRFRLIVHEETRDLPIYALVLAREDGKPGPQLTRSAVDCATTRGCGVNTSSGSMGTVITLTGSPLSGLLDELATAVDRTVVDRTGLTGAFDLELRFRRETLQGGPSSANDPSVFTAVQEQLGLKLESSRGPVNVLVVDRIDRPTPD